MAKEKQETRFSAELLDELLEHQAATVLRSDGLVGSEEGVGRTDAERDGRASRWGDRAGRRPSKRLEPEDGTQRRRRAGAVDRDRQLRSRPDPINEDRRHRRVVSHARHPGACRRTDRDFTSFRWDIRSCRSWWQARPLEATYAMDRSGSRDEGLVRNKAVYLAIGVRCSGHKDILGLWIEQTEGAKFWLRVMNDLHSARPLT